MLSHVLNGLRWLREIAQFPNELSQSLDRFFRIRPNRLQSGNRAPIEIRPHHIDQAKRGKLTFRGHQPGLGAKNVCAADEFSRRSRVQPELIHNRDYTRSAHAFGG